MLLREKLVLITGASRGIGRAIAIESAKEGADVVINYANHRSEKLALKVASIVREYGREAIVVRADVSNWNEVVEMKKKVEEFGKVDVVVNNAGITRDSLITKMSINDWHTVINVNLTGAFYVTRAFIDHLIEKRGVLIFVTSVVGQDGNVGQCNYAASKAGLIGMAKALALELARFGVRVLAVAPGFTETDMTANIPGKVYEKIIEKIPVRRFAKPEEIAKPVVFLASDYASYITGVCVPISGGMYRI